MKFLIIIGIIIGILFLKEMIEWIDDATSSSSWEKELKKREKEREEGIRKDIEQQKQHEKEIKDRIDKVIKESDYYYQKYKNSANTMEIISVLKAKMRDLPSNWQFKLHRHGVAYCFSFSQHGYKDLTSDEQVYGLARAIAYNLGNGFETTIGYDYDNGIDIHVKYKFTKPVLKEF